ncbi:MAG: tetratricopeptide repeat protein [Candidatus Rhabdochlamydia sp.]
MSLVTKLRSNDPALQTVTQKLMQLDKGAHLSQSAMREVNKITQITAPLLKKFGFLLPQHPKIVRFFNLITGIYIAFRAVPFAQLFAKRRAVPLLAKLSARQLECLQTMKVLPHRVEAYLTLASSLIGNQQQVQVDEKLFNQQSLYLKAIQLFPKNGDSYFQLGKTLRASHTVKLLDGTVMTNQQLYLKAISLNPHVVEPYLQLADQLKTNQTVKLLDGHVLNKQDMYLKVISIDPSHGEAHFKLALTLDAHDKILLHGDEMTRDLLYQVASDLGYPHYVD